MQRSQNSLIIRDEINEDGQISKWAIRNHARITATHRAAKLPPLEILHFYKVETDTMSFKYENVYSIEIKESDLMKLISKDIALSRYETVDIPALDSLMKEKHQIEKLCKKFPALDHAKKNYELILEMVRQ